MTDRAREALELVESDDEARRVFVAAYGAHAAHGDALAALREDVDPDVAAVAALDERVARLRRLAFGRTETVEDEATALDARRDLEALTAAERAGSAALDRAVTAVLEARAHPSTVEESQIPGAQPSDPTSPPEDHDHDRDRDHRDDRARPWRRWVLPAVIGLVVGAVVASTVAMWMPRAIVGASEEPTPGATPTGVEYFLGDPPESTAIPGDLAASERWFEPAQTDADLVGVGELRSEFDRGSVRLVHNSPLARVWVAKKVDGNLCLETTETETQITSGTCAAPDEFTARGISVSSNVLTATWNGAQIRVVLTRR